MATSRALRKTGWYALLTGLSLVVLFPIYLTIVRAVSQPVSYVDAGQPLHPVDVQRGVFGDAWSQGHLASAMLRSTVMTVLITVAEVVTSVLAAYALVFIRFPFKRILFALCMATLLLPIEVTLLANASTIRQLHWINSMQALVLPFAANALGIFLLRQAFAGIPRDLHDAAKLDGYGHVAFMTKFVVPLTRPVLGAFTLIAALTAWGQYLWPRTVIEDSDAWTLQLAITRLLGTRPEQANVGVAGALIAAVPVVILLVIFQRQIVRGLTAGAVKG
jgi:sn-glycerol 3-phosphate transport system permease protein